MSGLGRNDFRVDMLELCISVGMFRAFIRLAIGLAREPEFHQSSSEIDTLQTAFREAGGKWSTFVIWAKNTFTLGRSDYQRQYEPILYGWKQGADHYWCGDRDQGDVWFFDKPAKNDLHPTMKPVALVERAIRNSSKSRDIVLDPFGGSGTTLIAAERTGRRARLIELDPKYADVAVQRWQDQTGQTARTRSVGAELQ